MNILSLTPGTGGTFYCQNCLRDGVMVRALRRAGHDVMVVPLYLPILLDAEGLDAHAGVFFGGVNVYLQQQTALFRRTPRWLDRLFDAPWMLRKAATREGSTSAADLGPMTYSMLQGRDGRQRKELERLLDWLRTQPRPDVAHISNALLLGVAREIGDALGVPVVCSLQDEDTWVDAMQPPWRERCWELMARRAAEIDLFVAVSDTYGARMAERLRLPRERVRTVHLGIELDAAAASAPLDFDPPTLGFLSRIHESQGFSALVDAFIALKKQPRFASLKLRATGGVTSGDVDYVAAMHAHVTAAGVKDDVEIAENFTKAARQEFLRGCDVLCVPAPGGEAFGLFILEAGALGVPVVQPDAGAFREIVEATGGGLVYDPREAGALEAAIAALLEDPARARALGACGRENVRARFSSDAMAAGMTRAFADAAAARGRA